VELAPKKASSTRQVIRDFPPPICTLTFNLPPGAGFVIINKVRFQAFFRGEPAMKRALSAMLVLVASFALVATSDVSGQDKKKEKDPMEGKKGKVIGLLTEKGPNFIEVKADGEEKGRRYVPHWVGGLPAQGGGPDKKMLKIISELKVGSRIEVDWEFEERLRVVAVKVLKAPVEKDKK
jgi:hypothetical protein